MIEKTILDSIINAALAEDIGRGDVTSNALIPASARATLRFVARQDLVACGGFILAAVYAKLDSNISVTQNATEGAKLKAGDVIATAQGPARALLTGERVALNLMQRMCGVASLTAKYVEAARGTKAVILDTRKTMPGLRLLDKYAVATGGGKNHRMRLDDMILIKDNHIVLAGGVTQAVKTARASSELPVVVECDTLAQVEEALHAKPDRILLDNMDVETLKRVVTLAAGRAQLEASGGVSLEKVAAIAQTGVDFISVGRITHSAPAADIGADITL